MDHSKLIFLISQPRSGSTLLQAILSNHQGIDTTNEAWVQLPLMSLLKPDLVKAKYDQVAALQGVDQFYQNTTSLFQNYKELLLNQYDTHRTQHENFIIDKTPRYYEILPELRSEYSESTIIILIRHPIRVLMSIIKTWNRRSTLDLYNYHFRDILMAPNLISEFFKTTKEDNLNIRIKYDNLVTEPEQEISSVLNNIRLEYSGEILNYKDNTSFLGKYGDPNLVSTGSILQRNDLESLHEEIMSSAHKNLLLGYGHYLGEELLQELGGYEYFSDFKRTKEFDFLRLHGEKSKGWKEEIKFRLYRRFLK